MRLRFRPGFYVSVGRICMWWSLGPRLGYNIRGDIWFCLNLKRTIRGGC